MLTAKESTPDTIKGANWSTAASEDKVANWVFPVELAPTVTGEKPATPMGKPAFLGELKSIIDPPMEMVIGVLVTLSMLRS